ncbi:MAG TPA: primosomal protein N', partial [Bauldia sp.]|nr:primosomal protein N' [Bauldia sp.]
MAGEKTVSVLVPVAVAAPYTYRAPADLEVGSIVEVPLGTRNTVGVIWDDPPDPEIGHNRLRPIEGVFEAPPLSPEIRKFVDWVADYTLTSRGMVLRMVLRSTGALAPEEPTAMVRRSGPPPARMTPSRQKVLDVVGDQAWAKSALAQAAGVTSSVVQGLIEAGTLEVALLPVPVPTQPDPDFARPQLSAGQEEGATVLRDAVAKGGYSVSLIDGVTGSGKTEVYFEAVAEALRRGKQALVLVPEIALTAEFLARFERRFGVRPGEWHSEVGPKGRERVWRGVSDGSIHVVVGARSALFLPFPELGLIIVDEEHDPSYKQEDGVCYQARDMAVLRASIAGIPIVLVSATPSLETVINVARERYARVHLPRRHAEAALPNIALVDMRRERLESGRFLSGRLVEALAEVFAAGEQALLFLNRRGYAPLTLCRACGYRLQCPNCTAWLVEHRFSGRLQCHHCGYGAPVPAVCPECLAPGSLVPC